MFRELEVQAMVHSGVPTEPPAPCNCPCAEPTPEDGDVAPTPGKVVNYAGDYAVMNG